jgi:hypothetical protein
MTAIQKRFAMPLNGDSEFWAYYRQTGSYGEDAAKGSCNFRLADNPEVTSR